MALPKWTVTSVTPHTDYTLTLTFASGETKIFNMTTRLDERPWAPLKNKELFMKPFISCGSVAWNDDIDIAPETLYKEGTPVGETNDQRLITTY